MKKVLGIMLIFVFFEVIAQRSNSMAIERFSNMSNSIDRMYQSFSSYSSYQAQKNWQILINKRAKISDNFGFWQNEKIDKIQKLYERIPVNKFNKKVNGIYAAHLINQKKLAYANETKLFVEEPILVNIVNDEIKDIYLYGKEKMRFDFHSEDPLILDKGKVEYFDSQNNMFTIFILEPYINNKRIEHQLIDGEVGYVVFWSSKKKYEGKVVYINELNQDGELVRQVETKIVFAKRKEDISRDKLIPLNINRKLEFLGKVVSSPMGNITYNPSISSWKKNSSEMKDGEERYVQIYRYYE